MTDSTSYATSAANAPQSVPQRGVSRRGLLLGAAGLGAAGALAAPTQTAEAAAAFSLAGQWSKTSRLRDLRISTSAIHRNGYARGTSYAYVLLPSDYNTSGKRYPVLYLLHGSGGNRHDWYAYGNVASLTARSGVIVVMPDGGHGGWYMDHANWTGGVMHWETFHMQHLVPAIDATYRTLATKSARAIAGVSMGGFGAMHYAARHNTLFSGVSSYSGALDISMGNFREEIYSAPTTDGENAGAIFNSWAYHENPTVLNANNPVRLASRLAGMRVSMTVGTGGGMEASMLTATRTMKNQLLAAGHKPSLYREYSGYGHDWGNWQRAFAEDLPVILSRLASPR